MNAVEQIITLVPEDASVLDVGAGGLHGENTTDALLDRFLDYTGVCKDLQEVEVYEAKRKERSVRPANIIPADFYEYDFDRKYDFIIHDLNVEANIEEWWTAFSRTAEKLKEDGYLLTYIITTTEYGDPLFTPHLIRKHWAEWWEDPEMKRESIGKKLRQLSEWELLLAVQEERRPYITWVLLKRK